MTSRSALLVSHLYPGVFQTIPGGLFLLFSTEFPLSGHLTLHLIPKLSIQTPDTRHPCHRMTQYTHRPHITHSLYIFSKQRLTDRHWPGLLEDFHLLCTL